MVDYIEPEGSLTIHGGKHAMLDTTTGILPATIERGTCYARPPILVVP